MSQLAAPRFSPERTVASIVAESPRTARVFEDLGIDYCCGGRVALADACAEKGLSAPLVLADLEAAVASAGPERDWSRESASAVIDHVLAVHHTFVRREIPRLRRLSDKVSRAHGAMHPEVLRVVRLWSYVADELTPHLWKEEQVLFPMIRAMVPPGGDPARALEGPMRVMETEHESVGEAMAEMRALATGYSVPDDACGSFRALWSGLDEFERDLHVHVHLENAVLFTQVRAMAGLSPAPRPGADR